jgi:hypothetical protein
MNSALPAVFIGSSTEGLDVAREIELQLQREADPTIWKDNVFQPGSNYLEALMNKLEQFDFAVMVLSPDDLLHSRGQENASPRDNVIFELGLFMGRLGRSRVFVVYQEGADLKLPSDLTGIVLLTYRTRQDNNLAASLSPAATPVIKAIRGLGFSDRKTHQNIQALQGRQEATEERLRTMQVLMKAAITEFEWQKLQGLSAPGPFIVRFHNSMIQELNRLDAIRYVRPKQGYGIESIRQRDGSAEEFDLKQYVELTNYGLEYIKLRTDLLKSSE